MTLLNGPKYSAMKSGCGIVAMARGDGRMDDAPRVCGHDYAFGKHDSRSQEEMEGILAEEQ